MIQKLLFAVLLFAQKMAVGQQCGYHGYYLFAVHAHTENNSNKIPHLKMYLTDENDNPYTAKVTFKEKEKWQTRYDTLFFWDNERAKKRTGNRPLIRQKMFHIGNYYVVAFYLDDLVRRDPSRQPLYKVKVETDETVMANNFYPDQSFFLPLKKAVEICTNSLAEDFSLSRPVLNLEGNPFTPIDIVLKEYKSAAIVNEPLIPTPSLVARLEYEKVTNAVAYNRIELRAKGANIYNTNNGQIHQYISIPGKVYLEKEISSIRMLKQGDFYNRNNPIKDFAVLIDEWRDTIHNVNREQFNFYIYNEKKNLFELDEILSQYPDVFYYPALKTMRRKEYIRTDKAKITNTYQLNKKKWELIDKVEELLPAYRATLPVKYSPKVCMLVGNNQHTFPLQAITGTNAQKTFSHTFTIYNGCTDTVYITNIRSDNKDFFRIKKALPPLKETSLFFEGTLYNKGEDFKNESFGVHLELEDKSIHSFYIQIPVIGNNSKVFYNPDSSVNYAIAQHNDTRYNMAIMTHPDGNIRARGLVLDADTAVKVGKWEYYTTGKWQLDIVTYSKELVLSVLNEKPEAYQYDGKPFAFNIKIKENNSWKQPITEWSRGGLRFFYPLTADSVIAYTDSTSYSFALQSEQMPASASMQLYLLKPNEPILKIGPYTMPFTTIKDVYVLILTPERIPVYRDEEKIKDSLYAALLKQYPKLSVVAVGHKQRGISLSGLAEKDKKQLLDQLEKNSLVAFVCQLFTATDQHRQSYCNNQVYVNLKVNEMERFKLTAMELGFTDMRADGYTSNNYWLTYKSKLVDEAFFAAFKKLTEHPLVGYAHFNTYSEIELDNKLHRK